MIASVSIANRLAMKMRRWFDPVGLIQQLANRDLRFARVVFPFGDGVCDAIVEADQAVAHGAEGGDPPKAFRAAENFTARVRRSAIGVVFEDCAAVLHHEHRKAAFVFRIICRTRAIAGLNLGERDGWNRDQRRRQAIAKPRMPRSTRS